jgi:hypothetical protein
MGKEEFFFGCFFCKGNFLGNERLEGLEGNFFGKDFLDIKAEKMKSLVI